MRTGYATLPLHGGRAPAWLFRRMVRLARALALHVLEAHGRDALLRRLSDPFWFQALGCALGFDWHSSGLTTTTTGALKEGLRGLERETGLCVAGGKGAAARRTPADLEAACAAWGTDAGALVRASRLAAKVDSAAVQDGYQIYHHAFVATREGRWCVVQQGMSDATGLARRYHWLGEGLESFVREPHAAVCCDARGETLNLVAEESARAQEALLAVARAPDRETGRLLGRLPELTLPRRHAVTAADLDPRRLRRVLLSTWERAPADFESLLLTPGLGAKALRALALVAELVHGTPASTRDPARFSFAHGGKDGTPYPVDRAVYDHTVAVLEDGLRRAPLARRERDAALRRLARFAAAEGRVTGDG